jgi:hypothetical protein
MSHVTSAALVQPADEEFLPWKPLQDRFCRDHSHSTLEAFFNRRPV